jgi:CheY-like chemotaxis protein
MQMPAAQQAASLAESGARRRIPGAIARRILVADDSPVNCLVAQRLLYNLGYPADIAVTGANATERHRKRPYDLILMDSQMAGADGFDLTSRMRAMQTARHVPIIACTTASSEEQRSACLRAGIDDVCVKPLQQAQLRNLLMLWLPPRTLEEASRRDAGTRAELLALAGLFGDGFAEVVTMFRTDTESRLLALRAAAEAGDGMQLRRLAHALGGSCSSMSGWRMSSLCRVLELKCLAGQGAGCARLLADIGNEHHALTLQLDHVLRCQQLVELNEQASAGRD